MDKCLTNCSLIAQNLPSQPYLLETPAIHKKNDYDKHNSKPITTPKPSGKHVRKDIQQLPTPPTSESESSSPASDTEKTPTLPSSRQDKTSWNPTIDGANIMDEPISLSCISLSTCQAMHLHHCALLPPTYPPSSANVLTSKSSFHNGAAIIQKHPSMSYAHLSRQLK